MKRTLKITLLISFLILFIISSCKGPINGPTQPHQDLRIKFINESPELVDLKKTHLALEVWDSSVFYMAEPFTESWETADKENERSFIIKPIASIDLWGKTKTNYNKRVWPDCTFKGRLHFYSHETKESIGQLEMPIKFEQMSRLHPVLSVKGDKGIKSVSISHKGAYNTPMVIKIKFTKDKKATIPTSKNL